jgi:putative addiction module killer protein
VGLRFLVISILLALPVQPAAGSVLSCWVAQIRGALKVSPTSTRIVPRGVSRPSAAALPKKSVVVVVKAVEKTTPPTTSRREAKLMGYTKNSPAVIPTKELVTSVDPNPKDHWATRPEYVQPVPGLKQDPYSPDEVAKRQEAFRKEFEQKPIEEALDARSGNYPYRIWYESLDNSTRLRVGSRLERAQRGEMGEKKQVSPGVWELKLDFGPGYRIYYMNKSDGMVLLNAGDKSTQSSDIVSAIRLKDQYANH